MDILPHKICLKHNLQAYQMCTRHQCYNEVNPNILVCKECRNDHLSHTNDLIDVNLLNDKVHQLMKKRMDFEMHFEQCCDAMITQLKKFKVIKQEIVNALNYRQRTLNELCKKIKRNLSYEKDNKLFKSHFGYVYLAMKGNNPNIDTYRLFRQNTYDCLKQCRNLLHKLQVNIKEVPMMLVKQHQISSILKKIRDQPIIQIEYCEPKLRQFEKKTIKIQGQQQSKIFRINNQQFLSFSKKGPFCRWFNINNYLPPRLLPLSSPVDHMALLGKNAFLTNQSGGILIYDLLNEVTIKQYASSNHRNASITNLLSLSSSKIINFVTCPNQMVAFNFDEDNQVLKLVKGVQMKSKCLASQNLSDQFVGCFDDKIVRLYRNEFLQKQTEYEFQYLMKSVCKMNDNNFLIGGQCNIVSMMDSRDKGVVNKFKIGQYCQEMKKIYPNSIITICGKMMTIFQLRMQKQLVSNRFEDQIKHLQVLNSQCFVLSNKNINIWKSMQ